MLNYVFELWYFQIRKLPISFFSKEILKKAVQFLFLVLKFLFPAKVIVEIYTCFIITAIVGTNLHVI